MCQSVGQLISQSVGQSAGCSNDWRLELATNLYPDSIPQVPAMLRFAACTSKTHKGLGSKQTRLRCSPPSGASAGCVRECDPGLYVATVLAAQTWRRPVDSVVHQVPHLPAVLQDAARQQPPQRQHIAARLLAQVDHSNAAQDFDGFNFRICDALQQQILQTCTVGSSAHIRNL